MSTRRGVAPPSLEIETPRLLLRPFTEDGVDDLLRVHADAEMTRFLTDDGSFDRARAWRQIAVFIGHIAMRGYGVLAVVERSSGRLIGRSGPWFPEGWPALEVGWVIERPRWGQGFATEAAAASLDYCWRELGATVVCSLIRPENIRSIRVAERLGARRDGTIADFLGGPVAVYLHSPPG